MRNAFGQQRSLPTALLANCAAIVRVWSTVAQLVKCRALDNFVIGAARLAKCADWSNAPYTDILANLWQWQFGNLII